MARPGQQRVPGCSDEVGNRLVRRYLASREKLLNPYTAILKTRPWPAASLHDLLRFLADHHAGVSWLRDAEPPAWRAGRRVHLREYGADAELGGRYVQLDLGIWTKAHDLESRTAWATTFGVEVRSAWTPWKQRHELAAGEVRLRLDTSLARTPGWDIPAYHVRAQYGWNRELIAASTTLLTFRNDEVATRDAEATVAVPVNQEVGRLLDWLIRIATRDVEGSAA